MYVRKSFNEKKIDPLFQIKEPEKSKSPNRLFESVNPAVCRPPVPNGLPNPPVLGAPNRLHEIKLIPVEEFK